MTAIPDKIIPLEICKTSDSCHLGTVYQPDTNEGLHQKLNTRHLTFISLGSVIGTGIFLGVGSALATAGPVGLVLAFAVICSVVYCVMLCTGEMVTYLPVVGAHMRLSGRFVDPSLSAAMSWNYWYCWALISAAEASAVAVLTTYWTKAVPTGVWITLCLALTLGVNLGGPRLFAEMEFYMSIIKVLTIVGLIILSIIIDAGGGPNGEYIGFKYWRTPGPFVQYEGIGGSSGRFLGFFSGLIAAAFSSIGAEMLALVAAETHNPRKIIPTALRATWIRVVLFYFLGAFCVTPMLSPSKKLASIINACILTSALSAGVSDLFTAVRTLHAMAGNGLAPRIFHKTTPWGCSWVAVLATWSLSLLAFLAVGSGSNNIFNYFLKLTSLSGIITWLCIAVTYLRFRAGMKAQGISHSFLPFKNCFTIIGACWIIIVITSILLFSGWPVFKKGNWDTPTFVVNYLPIAIFAIVFLGFKLITKSRFVRASEMDLMTGLAEIEKRAAEAKEQEEQMREVKRHNIFKLLLKRIVA